MLANGNTTEPAMVPVVPTPRQNPLVLSGNVGVELAVSVCVALAHVLPGTEAPVTVIVQRPLPMLITALPFVTSTAVALVAVAVQDALDVTTVGEAPRLFEQLLNVGPASVPAAFVVWARSPVAFTFRVTVHSTLAEPDLSVRVPCPCTTVPCGSHVAAEADEAPTSAITIEAAATAVPNFFMLRMLLSFCRS
jgi:hypothetical protein